MLIWKRLVGGGGGGGGGGSPPIFLIPAMQMQIASTLCM
jgi:hypothetical protein